MTKDEFKSIFREHKDAVWIYLPGRGRFVLTLSRTNLGSHDLTSLGTYMYRHRRYRPRNAHDAKESFVRR